MNRNFRPLVILAVLCMALASGCARFSTERGVENKWRGGAMPVFESGRTTQAEILEVFGPPSQIISLNDGSVFYYLREQGKGKGLILLVYNQVEYKVGYDRAIFFFDGEGILTEYAYSDPVVPPAEEEVSEEAS